MANIKYNIFPNSTWKVLETEYNNVDEIRKVGVALYPDFIIWKPTEILENVTFVDKYNNQYNIANYELIIYQQFMVDLFEYRKALKLDITNYDFYNKSNLTLNAVNKMLGITQAPTSDLMFIVDESKLPFKKPSDIELGKIENITDGSYPYTGFYESDVKELPSMRLFCPFASASNSTGGIIEGTLYDINSYLNFSESVKYKLPILFSPIIGNEVVNYCSNICCTYFGIQKRG